ncbi:MAG: S-adenosylmethionine:tRNA ribosyltransferase-isomerase [Segetibacter sp.]|nr:S-adenosylmethionine:tRNA ribosyltransferase-isomerase [Segetibacter sp.]
MDPRTISILDYTYELPEEKVAKFPLEDRDSSKLLVFKNGVIEEASYKEIHHFLPPKSLLVFNNTRVVEARLLFKKDTGAKIEVFCLEPADQYADITSAMLQKDKVLWKVLIGGASKWKQGMILQKEVQHDEQEIILSAAIVERLSDCFLVEFNWEPADLSFAEVLHLAGQIPLPPYLHRHAEESDKERYQTIYAKSEGSVAAPTAGLHFTDSVFKNLGVRNIKTDFVTLHVGAGTFKPVKAEVLREHEMHAEFIDVNISTIENLATNVWDNIFAVGTTAMRTLESLYWIGVKISRNPIIKATELEVDQWEPYESGVTAGAKESLDGLVAWMKRNEIERLITRTRILIAPGYKLRVVKGIVTNFHQPQSTLLLLISALIGDDWKKVYTYALEHEFRFLSYGDGCLLFADQTSLITSSEVEVLDAPNCGY